MAYVTVKDSDDASGYYQGSTETLYVDAFETDDVPLHELMHAVQAVYIDLDTLWIVEGLAAAS